MKKKNALPRHEGRMETEIFSYPKIPCLETGNQKARRRGHARTYIEN